MKGGFESTRRCVVCSSQFNRFQGGIEEIHNKFIDSLHLYLAARVGRQGALEEKMSRPFRAVDIGTARFVSTLVLYVAWEVVEIQDALEKRMRRSLRAWGLSDSSVKVLNESGARRHGLVA